MQDRWSFTVDCPRCGGELTHRTGSQPRHAANLDSRAIAECAACKDTYILELTLRSERDRRSTLRSLPHHDTASGRFAPRPKALEPLPLEVSS